jgi:syndecan 4
MKKIMLALIMGVALISTDAFAATKQKCPAGTYSAKGASACTDCEGNTISAAGASSCTPCKTGTQANTNHTVCETACPANASCANGVANFVCNAGYYKASSTAKTCTLCTAGYKCTGNNERVQCPANTRSNAGWGHCEACPNLTYSGAGSATCTACTANSIRCTSASDFTCKDGYYENTATHKCVECPAGYYCKN